MIRKDTDDVRHLVRELRRASYMKKPSGYTIRRAAALLEVLDDEITYGNYRHKDEVAQLKAWLLNDNKRAETKGYQYDADREVFEEHINELSAQLAAAEVRVRELESTLMKASQTTVEGIVLREQIERGGVV